MMRELTLVCSQQKTKPGAWISRPWTKTELERTASFTNTMHNSDERAHSPGTIEATHSHKDRKYMSIRVLSLRLSRLVILLWKCKCKFILNFMFIQHNCIVSYCTHIHHMSGTKDSLFLMCNRDTSSDFRFTTSSISFDYQLKFKDGYLEWAFEDRLIIIKSNLHEEGNNSWLQNPVPKH